FSFSLFFKTLEIYKSNIEVDLIYNPLGLEKKHANRLNFCAILQLILLFWLGAESLYHPQLINNYYLYFVLIFIFLYTFSFYWIFIDLWKYSKIEIISKDIDSKDIQNFSKNLDNVISFLKLKHFNIISIVNFMVFIILNLLNIIFAYLAFNGFISGIKYFLPGTGIEDSEPIILSYIIYLIMIIPPSMTIIFLFLNHRDINDINRDKLNKILNSLPKDIQIKIIENLKRLNKKLNKALRIE
ncbi:MAG: hypothetical protein ACFFAN_20925, partial [Promethearchaeota archaeon]